MGYSVVGRSCGRSESARSRASRFVRRRRRQAHGVNQQHLGQTGDQRPAAFARLRQLGAHVVERCVSGYDEMMRDPHESVVPMEALPEDQRACVALCLGEGFSHAEAAEALGMPLGTVKSHVLRGRERLLRALGGEP